MLKVSITRAISITDVETGKSVDLKPGVHMIDPRVFDEETPGSWFANALKKRGVITIVGKKTLPVKEPPSDIVKTNVTYEHPQVAIPVPQVVVNEIPTVTEKPVKAEPEPAEEKPKPTGKKSKLKRSKE